SCCSDHGDVNDTQVQRHAVAFLGDAVPQLLPAILRPADDCQDGAPIAGRLADGLGHLHGLLSGGPPSGLCLCPCDLDLVEIARAGLLARRFGFGSSARSALRDSRRRGGLTGTGSQSDRMAPLAIAGGSGTAFLRGFDLRPPSPAMVLAHGTPRRSRSVL